MRRRLAPWIVVIGAALLYPVIVLAGGGARFPSREECVHPATRIGSIEAVFGRFTTTTAAQSLLRRAVASGFEHLEIEPDGCGLLKVTLHDIPSLSVGRAFVAEAQGVGFQPRLEQQAP